MLHRRWRIRSWLAGLAAAAVCGVELHAQDRVYLLYRTNIDSFTHIVEAEIRSDGSWLDRRTMVVRSIDTPVVADGGRYLYALSAFNVASVQFQLARGDLVTGATSVYLDLEFPAGTTLVADRRGARVFAVAPEAVSVVDGGQLLQTIALPPLPTPPTGRLEVLAAIGGRRLVVVRQTAVGAFSYDVSIVNVDSGAVERTLPIPGGIATGVATSRDGSRFVVTTIAAPFGGPGATLLFDATTGTPMASAPNPAGSAPPMLLVESARNLVVRAERGTPFGGGSPNGPTGFPVSDASTLAPIGVVLPGFFDGRDVLAVSRASERSPLVSISQETYPGYAGGPRAPRADIVDGRTGRAVGRRDLGVAPMHGVFILEVPVPDAPPAPSVIVTGHSVTLTWDEADFANQYQIEAGSAAGLANLVRQGTGRARSVTYAGVPSGTYFVRVRGVNEVGAGDPSPDITVTVP